MMQIGFEDSLWRSGGHYVLGFPGVKGYGFGGLSSQVYELQ